MLNTTLLEALNAASIIKCNGLDIDNFVADTDCRLRLDSGDTHVALLADQEIVIDSDGCARVPMHDATETADLGLNPKAIVDLEFRVTSPLRAEHLP